MDDVEKKVYKKETINVELAHGHGANLKRKRIVGSMEKFPRDNRDNRDSRDNRDMRDSRFERRDYRDYPRRDT